MEVIEQSPTSALRAQALVRAITPPILLTPISAVHPWQLRTLLAPWLCCGTPFLLCAISLRTVATPSITPLSTLIRPNAEPRVLRTTSMVGAGLIFLLRWGEAHLHQRLL